MTELIDKERLIKEWLDLKYRCLPHMPGSGDIDHLFCRVKEGEFDAKPEPDDCEICRWRKTCPNGLVYYGIRNQRCKTGMFDAKPEPEIRTLPKCPGSLQTKTYDMTAIEGKLTYLIDITDLLVGFQNTHLEKAHLPINNQFETFEKFRKHIEMQMQAVLKNVGGAQPLPPYTRKTIESRISKLEQKCNCFTCPETCRKCEESKYDRILRPCVADTTHPCRAGSTKCDWNNETKMCSK